MFVRFRQTKTTLQVTLLAMRRVSGRVRQEQVAASGAIKLPLTVSGREAFWRELHAVLARLENRVCADVRAEILASVQARIPTVTAEEALHEIALAEREREVWDMVTELLAERATATAELASEASATSAAARASAGDAFLRSCAARERIERLRRGEAVPPGEELDVERILCAAGWTQADMDHAMTVVALPAEATEDLIAAGRKASTCAERARARGLLRQLGSK